MEMKSVSGLTCYVNDLARTAEFYKTLGFRLGVYEPDQHLTIYLNWFSINFVAMDSAATTEFEAEATAQTKGSGIYINIKVDNADAFYKDVVAKGLTPSSEPRDWEWGNREFVLRDPDGYKLVFFQKK